MAAPEAEASACLQVLFFQLVVIHILSVLFHCNMAYFTQQMLFTSHILHQHLLVVPVFLFRQMLLGLQVKWSDILSRLCSCLSPAECYIAALSKPEMRLGDYPPLTAQQEDEAEQLNEVRICGLVLSFLSLSIAKQQDPPPETSMFVHTNRDAVSTAAGQVRTAL